MIREYGLFVLMGSKPMSTFNIDIGFPETEEEYKRYYESCNRDVNLSEHMPEYEEFKKSCIEDVHLRDRHLWKVWQEKMKDLKLSPTYKFVARKPPFGDDHDVHGLFINVPSTLYVLKFHYNAFSRITGISFDPEIILDEISNNSSEFWEKAFHSHYLMGLMFGFGERNAVCFEWETQHDLSLPTFKCTDQKTIDDIFELSCKKYITLSDLKLPFFGVYALNDQTIKRYKREKRFILEQFKGKDFMEVVTNWLSGNISFEGLVPLYIQDKEK